MQERPAYEALAEAFRCEGVEALFVLMGDGNMHWATAMSAQNGVRTIHTRHEHCACAAAIGYAVATGRVGVASVTCGPGFTQISTALATAARGRVPIVVFAGEAPISARWHNQSIDQAPIATAAGAHYIRALSPDRLLDSVREAFFIARYERCPVVLGIPYDLQKHSLPAALNYNPSSKILPPASPGYPDPGIVEQLAARIAASQKPIIVAGRGAVLAGAKHEIETLAAQCGALLSTTLLAKGLFDEDEFSLGIAGGFGSDLSLELFAEADLVIAIGASLSHHTRHGGKLYPNAFVAQIDTHPLGLKHGLPAADLFLVADARKGVEAVVRKLEEHQGSSGGFRSPALAQRISTERSDPTVYSIEPQTLDPRAVIAALDEVIPTDWHVVSGGGHSAYFTTLMRGRDPEFFHTIRDFGAIGSGLSYAIGIAVAKPDENVVLIEGDGGLIMHIQELETIRRHNIRLLVCVLNDGAYGAELHKLREEGVDPSGSVFGREDFASVAKGFRLGGFNVTKTDELMPLFEDYRHAGKAEIWNIHISDAVVSPQIRRRYAHR